MRHARAAVALLKESLGDEHPSLGDAYHNLGLVLIEEGEDVAAVAALRKTLEIYGTSLGEDHPRVAQATKHLDGILAKQR